MEEGERGARHNAAETRGELFCKSAHIYPISNLGIKVRLPDKWGTYEKLGAFIP